MNVLIGPYPTDNAPRKVEIRIDPFDSWSADHTLALIIVPLLKQLKDTKQGAPSIDDEDVPEHLRSTVALPKESEWDLDSNWFSRWDWVMDEMIWTMEQIVLDSDDQFYDYSNVDKDSDVKTQIIQLKVDDDGLEKYHFRIKNGCRLFGKYFRCLWD
jgi:hypothetical protein